MRISTTDDDDLIQSFSNTAQRQFKKILGLDQSDPLPDNDSISMALRIQVQCYYENRAFLKPAAGEAMNQAVLNLLAADRDDKQFIPEVATQ